MLLFVEFCVKIISQDVNKHIKGGDKVKKLSIKLMRVISVVLLLTCALIPTLTCYANAETPFFARGIDVSRHNGNIDWVAVKNSGVDFAIIRTSYGWENWDRQTDAQLINNINGAKSVGIPIGAYHYSYATTVDEALREADFFLEKLKLTQWEYPVFLDFEDKCQIALANNQQRTDIIKAFALKIRSAGYYVGMYSFLNMVKNNLDMSQLSEFELWIAHWSSNCGCECPYGIWQYTSDGAVPGINGRVDLDYSYVDYPTIIKNLHMNGF